MNMMPPEGSSYADTATGFKPTPRDFSPYIRNSSVFIANTICRYLPPKHLRESPVYRLPSLKEAIEEMPLVLNKCECVCVF